MTAAADELLCPVCGSESVHPARPRVLDRLVRLTGARPYWCADCGERFRSTAPLPLGPGMEFTASEAVPAVCPNCERETVIRLTPGEREMAVQEGWVVSCPDCRALFPFIRPS
ncbi:MAG: hypothetical protein KF861_07525 [Planctomycetaceae bacterium]|nr:hypothetical protein [Planctomycetaceae bacterium]